MTLLFLVVSGAWAEDLSGLDEPEAPENRVSFTWHPVMVLNLGLVAGAEWRVADSKMSVGVWGGPYFYYGVGVLGMAQMRGYFYGDFDRGLYAGGHIGASYSEDPYYWYVTAATGAVSGGKWTWNSGFTMDAGWGFGLATDGPRLFITYSIGWSW